MSEPSLPQTPARTIRRHTPQARGQNPREVRIERLPADLAILKTAAKIEARVQEIKQDQARIILETSRGQIEVRVQDPSLALRLVEGQVVELHIPGGDPPRHAEIVILPAPDARTQSLQTPVNVVIQPAETSNSVQLQNLPLPQVLQAEQALPPFPIRLEHVPAVQLPVILNTPVDILPAQLPEVFQTTIALPPDVFPPASNISELPAVITVRIETLPPPLPLPQIQNLIQATPFHFQTKIPVQSTLLLPTTTSVQIIAPPPILTPDQKPLAPPVLVTQPSIVAHAFSPALSADTPIVQTALNIPLNHLPAPTAHIPESLILSSVQTALVSPAVATTPSLDNPLLVAQNLTFDITLQPAQAGYQSAVVIGETPERLPVLALQSGGSTPPQFFILHSPFDNITPGQQVSFIAQNPETALPGFQISAESLGGLPNPISFLTPEIWPSMTRTLQALSQSAPQVAQAFSNMMPNTANPAQLTAAAMFFIAAVRAGDIGAWMGNRTVDTIRRAGGEGMLNRLGAENGALSRLAAEPVGQDWRGLSLPLQIGQEIHKMALYYKQDDDEHDENGQNGGKQTRFVFDLNFPSMGGVQIDGLFKPGRLDIILRTQKHFSDTMRMDMRRLYADALRETDVTGELSFQSRDEGWVKITPDQKNEGVQV